MKDCGQQADNSAVQRSGPRGQNGNPAGAAMALTILNNMTISQKQELAAIDFAAGQLGQEAIELVSILVKRTPMTSAQEGPETMNSLSPAMSSVSRSDREIRRLRIFLLVLMLAELISVVVSRSSSQWRSEFRFLPQILIGFSVLALIFTLHLASQHKLLREVSTALIVATSYADKLEQCSLIDAPTQLFNRRYLEELFNHQLKWLNRSGRSASLLLLEVLPNGQKAAAEEIVIEAAFILRSNFRGSDYLVRYFTDQFLVVLPDTDEQHAQIALSRLIDKVDHWNRANEKCEMALRLALSICPPGGNIWEKLSEIEERIQDKTDPGVRTLISMKPTAYESNDIRPQGNLVQ